MGLFWYKILISPALVGVATLAGRRWGDRAAGLVAGLPIVAGPILFFYALEQGPAFAGRAAVATLLGMVSLCAFLLTYAWRAWSGGSILSSLLLGWVAFAGATLMIDRILDLHPVGPVKALVYALAALYLGRRSLPPEAGAPAEGPDRVPGRWDLALRMAAAAVLVLALTSMARRVGPALGGLLTPFPVASSVLAAFAHRQGGRGAACAVLKGLFLAFNSFAVFCAVLGAALVATGLVPGFIAAAAAAALVHAYVLRRGRPVAPA